MERVDGLILTGENRSTGTWRKTLY